MRHVYPRSVSHNPWIAPVRLPAESLGQWKSTTMKGGAMSKKTLLGATLTALLTFGGVAAPAAIAQDNTDATTDNNGDDNGLWGLAGLLGLAGLAGLKRRDEVRTDRSSYSRAT